MRDNLSTITLQHPAPNIPEDISKAIVQLKDNKNLIIREADKGSCIVLMDKNTYVTEGHQHLSDSKIYCRTESDKTLQVAHKANWAVRHHKDVGQLSNYMFNKLTKDLKTVRTQELYFLRKVHKDPHTIRPICSCSSGPTEKLSGYLCRVLTPHLEDVRSLVRNSQQVVQILEGLNLSANRDVTLVTLDVEALYPSIPQTAGIEMVLQRVVPTAPPTTTSNSFKNMLRDFLRVVIRDNHFRFNDQHYDQKRGVAMGTRCAPPFANLFLASLEERALAEWGGPAPALWLRFLDDVLMLWTSTSTTLDEFVAHLNSRMTSIKFTYKSSQTSATFLDLQIYKGSRFDLSGVLDTKLFVKATNPQKFLHFSSCHPNNTYCKRGTDKSYEVHLR